MGVRKGLEGKEEWVKKEGLMIREVRWKKEKWRLATVYVNGNLDKIMGEIKSVKKKEGREKRWIVGAISMREQGRKERWRMEKRELKEYVIDCIFQ